MSGTAARGSSSGRVPVDGPVDGPTDSAIDSAADRAVECTDLVVRYGATTAVDGLSFTARRGQVVALLGPNGAGKTSTVETLEGYRRPFTGHVRVLGLDPRVEHARLTPRIGVMLQRGGIYPTMGPRRVLHLFARYYDEPEDPEALLDLVGLRAVAATPWRRLSGGEQQRLSLALALMGRPEVLFLDEPTAGVDPEGRMAVRRAVTEAAGRGACVLLTTHELPEAERLADEVLIVARGRAVARGTVAELAAAGGGGIRFEAPPGLDTADLAAALAAVEPAATEPAPAEPAAGAAAAPPAAVTEEQPGRYRVAGEATPARLAALARWLAEHDLPLAELRAGRRSLEEIYLRLTMEDAERDRSEVVGDDAPGARRP